MMIHPAWACPGFLKGGSNISWFPKKRLSDFKWGSNGLIGGGGGGGKCCPKLHIKQLRNNLHYICCLKLHVLVL